MYQVFELLIKLLFKQFSFWSVIITRILYFVHNPSFNLLVLFPGALILVQF
jgi:hypothetical protein